MTHQSIESIPSIGFGLWKIANENCANVVYEAVKQGYRHFDSASDYGNEKEVGMGLKRAMEDGLCTREELWITSKLWNTFHHPDHVPAALQRSLEDLQLDYLDLYLIHFPIALEFVPFEERYPPEWFFAPEEINPQMKLARVPLADTWKAMENLKIKEIVKNIGVCNYSTGLLHDLMNYCQTPPDLLQIESHPYLCQENLIRLAKQYGLKVTAFSPLGSLSYVELEMAEQNESILDQEIVRVISKRLGCSPAQTVLRWGIQRGNSVVAKSVNANRMAENLASSLIELTDEDMMAITNLDRGRRFNDPGNFCEGAFNTFHPIYD
jgi:D-xylose reductase|tara:strand:- start:351 stop:1319 length:969 start_codon:yes stop_codon:yes gene_type:complete